MHQSVSDRIVHEHHLFSLIWVENMDSGSVRREKLKTLAHLLNYHMQDHIMDVSHVTCGFCTKIFTHSSKYIYNLLDCVLFVLHKIETDLGQTVVKYKT